MRSLISSLDLSREEILDILKRAREFKEGKRVELQGDLALLFFEASTRTRVSFEKAAKDLGLSTYIVISSQSSITKGESFYDTLKTFEALGFKAVVFRVPFVLYPYKDLVQSLKLSLVNAGDGTHQHPTQGLIDLFTLMENFGSLENLKVLYVGDILFSRVFRSGVPLLREFGAKVSVCAPKTLLPRETGVFGLEEVFDELDEALEWADVAVWLRLQEERQKESYIPSKESYFKKFGLTKERHESFKGVFMHPGPVNRNVDIDGDLIYSDKSLIYEQVQNGLSVRKAVLEWIME